MSSGEMRAGCAGSTMTAIRRVPSPTRQTPCRTTQLPERARTRPTAISPGSSGRSAVRSARPATESTDDGSFPRSQSPSGSSQSQRSTPGGGGFDLPAVREHDQTGGHGALRIPRLRDEQSPAGTLGQGGRHGPDEFQLFGSEQRLAGLAVEAERPPDLTAFRPKARDHLLISPIGHVLVPAGAQRGITSRRLMQGRNSLCRAGDVDELVDVLSVVLVGEPLFWDLGQAVVKVTRYEQRGGFEGVPAGRPVVGDGAGDNLARLLPETHEVEALLRQPGDLVGCSLLRVLTHTSTVSPGGQGADTTFLEWATPGVTYSFDVDHRR